MPFPMFPLKPPSRRVALALMLLSFAAAAFSLIRHDLPAQVEQQQAESGLPQQDVVVKTQAGDVTLRLEIARESVDLEMGLMYRKTMPEKHGMLFWFGRDQMLSFWMKNTYLSLDLIFVDAAGVIRHIHPDAVPLDETPMSSVEPAAVVIEINAGEAARLKIRPGDRVILPAL